MLYTEDGSGNGTSLNLSGISGNVIGTARMDEGTEDYFYYHKDMAGSTTNLRNASGETIVSYQYSEFGETSIYGDTDFYNEICYNGGIYDESTGLYYLNARYYNPEDGRFISRDSYRGSVTNPSTLHLYAYCVNNPVNYSDPSGHFAISKIVGGIVGGLLGAAAGAKIAKSAGLTGWKKVAAIAGGAAIGATVGVLAVKTVAKTASKILPSKSEIVNNFENSSVKLKQNINRKNENYTKIKEIFRAVDPEEYDDIFATGKFRPRADGRSLKAKEFGNVFEETLEFANHPINSDKAAIVKVSIPESMYKQLHHMNLDRTIFKSGTPVVEPSMLEAFNKSIINITHVF